MHYPIDEGLLQSLIHKEVRGLTPDLFAVLLREFNILTFFSFIALPVNVYASVISVKITVSAVLPPAWFAQFSLKYTKKL